MHCVCFLASSLHHDPAAQGCGSGDPSGQYSPLTHVAMVVALAHAEPAGQRPSVVACSAVRAWGQYACLPAPVDVHSCCELGTVQKWPAAHSASATAPAPQYRPLPQAMHASLPALGWYLPAAQSSHGLAGLVDDRPAAHGVAFVLRTGQ